LLGRSFGGTTVLAAGAGDTRVAGYILWSAPVLLEKTFRNLMAEAYDKLAGGQLVSVNDENGSFLLEPALVLDFKRHDMDAYLQTIGDRPALILHGMDDETVAVDNASYIQERLRNARVHLIPGADHRFNGMTEMRENLTMDWLTSQRQG